MPHEYKSTSRRPNIKHSAHDIQKTLDLRRQGKSYRYIEQAIGIPKSVVHRHHKSMMNEEPLKTKGGQPVFCAETENILVSRIILMSEWSYPLDSYELRLLIKSMLDRKGTRSKIFKNNMPGRDWVKTFLKRNSAKIGTRRCQNVKRQRAEVSPEIVEQYFEELKETVRNVPPENIYQL